jgi:putative chitinase
LKNFDTYFRELNESNALDATVDQTLSKLRKMAFGGEGQTSANAKYLLISTLKKHGITSAKAIANIMAQVAAESGLDAKSENCNWSKSQLLKLWGPDNKKGNTVKIKSAKHAEDVAKLSPVKKANMLYAGINKNGSEESGDGYRYRGRGFIQLSQRGNYASMGKKLGVDLIANPDLVNDPEYTFDIVALYFKGKAGGDISKLNDFNNVDSYVGHATNDKKKREENSKLIANALEKELPKLDYVIAKHPKQYSDTIKNFDVQNIDRNVLKSSSQEDVAAGIMATPLLYNVLDSVFDKNKNAPSQASTLATNNTEKEEEEENKGKLYTEYKDMHILAKEIYANKGKFYYA